MTIEVSEDGQISIYQGDSGEIVLNNIPTDQNYKVFFAIQDQKRNFIGNEVITNSNNLSSVSIKLLPELTDKLSVPAGKNFEKYFYGVKIVTPGTQEENTLFISGGGFGSVNTLIVYPKKAEGV